MNEGKRRQNETKFGVWEELSTGGRRYWYEVKSRSGWKARYVKEVDEDERTEKFYQEIYDEEGNLWKFMKSIPLTKAIRRSKGSERSWLLVKMWLVD